MPCMCGDTQCWSCGPAQGYSLDDFESQCDRCGADEWHSYLTDAVWVRGGKKQSGSVCEQCAERKDVEVWDA